MLWLNESPWASDLTITSSSRKVLPFLQQLVFKKKQNVEQNPTIITKTETLFCCLPGCISALLARCILFYSKFNAVWILAWIMICACLWSFNLWLCCIDAGVWGCKHKRRQWELNPCGQSTVDFKSIFLTTRTQRLVGIFSTMPMNILRCKLDR